MSTDKKGTRILAKTFFAQLRAGGYSPAQVVEIATELLGQVTDEVEGEESAPDVSFGAVEAPRVEARVEA